MNLFLVLAVLSADTAVPATDCSALTTILDGLEDRCWRAVAEDEVRAVGRDAKTLAKEDGVELGTLQDAAGFPFEFSDADGTEARKCTGDLVAAMKAPSAQACKERISALIKTRLAKELHSFAEQFTKFRSADGYGKTRWAMTSAEVRKAVSGLPAKGPLIKADTIAGRRATVAYAFVRERLTMVLVAFTERQLNAQRYLEDFQSVTATLAEKYGQPSQNELVFSSSLENDLYGDTPALAISRGHARAVAEWRREKTTVTATCAATGPFDIALSIIYASAELAEWGEKHANREAAKDL